MGFRFRKSINLGGGFRVNLSKSGVGYSWGTKGVRYTKTAKGKKRTTVSIPGTGISYVSGESGKKKASRSLRGTGRSASDTTVPVPANPQKSIEKRGTAVLWIDFAICFFLGILGVHKFREKKTGMGILYLLTGGLLGFGWIYDCIKYLIAALKSLDGTAQGQIAEPVETFGTAGQDLPEPQKSSGIKKTLLWVLTVFFVLVGLAYLPAFSGFLALGVAVLAAPIQKWQDILAKYVKGKAKTIVIVILAVLSIGTAPAAETPDTDIPSEMISMAAEESKEAAREATAATEPEATVETSIETAVETTAEPNVEQTTAPTTAPTSEPTTVPVTEPTTAPTSEPTTAPATEPTTLPITAPSTEPATEATEDNGRDYVVNTNTGKFHYPSCSSADDIKAENRWDYHGTRDDLINMGYVPCKRCDP